MKKNTLKIILVIAISIIFVFIFCHISLAGETGIIDPSDYKPDNLDSVSGADELKDIGNSIIGFLQIVGSIISVVVLVALGIKYMVGSAEEKAEYKKSMMPYLIGAVMVFAITNLLSIIVNVAQELV